MTIVVRLLLIFNSFTAEIFFFFFLQKCKCLYENFLAFSRIDRLFDKGYVLGFSIACLLLPCLYQ